MARVASTGKQPENPVQKSPIIPDLTPIETAQIKTASEQSSIHSEGLDVKGEVSEEERQEINTDFTPK